MGGRECGGVGGVGGQGGVVSGGGGSWGVRSGVAGVGSGLSIVFDEGRINVRKYLGFALGIARFTIHRNHPQHRWLVSTEFCVPDYYQQPPSSSFSQTTHPCPCSHAPIDSPPFSSPWLDSPCPIGQRHFHPVPCPIWCRLSRELSRPFNRLF